MAGPEWLAHRFEEHRPRLRRLAHQMLGSAGEADDALQDAWVRVSQAGVEGVVNLDGWFTTVVSRVCLNELRSRKTRSETLGKVLIPDPIVLPDPAVAPTPTRQADDELLLAESVSLAFLVVLRRLSPAERVAFVLHDLFGESYEEVASILNRSLEATRQLASRARRRIRDAELPYADPIRSREREVVDAFFRAAREGDVTGLIRLLDPDIVLRADFGPGNPGISEVVQGADVVARRARAAPETTIHPAMVNGTCGAVITLNREPFAIMGFTVRRDRIAAIDIFGDPARVARIAGAVLVQG